MAIALPAGSPARTYAAIDFGRYVDVASTSAEPRTVRVDSTVAPDKVSSILVRGDVTKLVTGVPKTFAAYMVLRGDLFAFTAAELQAELAYQGSIWTLANLNAMLRKER